MLHEQVLRQLQKLWDNKNSAINFLHFELINHVLSVTVKIKYLDKNWYNRHTTENSTIDNNMCQKRKKLENTSTLSKGYIDFSLWSLF